MEAGHTHHDRPRSGRPKLCHVFSAQDLQECKHALRCGRAGKGKPHGIVWTGRSVATVPACARVLAKYGKTAKALMTALLQMFPDLLIVKQRIKPALTIGNMARRLACATQRLALNDAQRKRLVMLDETHTFTDKMLVGNKRQRAVVPYGAKPTDIAVEPRLTAGIKDVAKYHELNVISPLVGTLCLSEKHSCVAAE
jgi:hypothetical protein